MIEKLMNGNKMISALLALFGTIVTTLVGAVVHFASTTADQLGKLNAIVEVGMVERRALAARVEDGLHDQTIWKTELSSSQRRLEDKVTELKETVDRNLPDKVR